MAGIEAFDRVFPGAEGDDKWVALAALEEGKTADDQVDKLWLNLGSRASDELFKKAVDKLLQPKGRVRQVPNTTEASSDLLPRLPGTASGEAKHAPFRLRQLNRDTPFSPFFLCGRPAAAKGIPIGLSESMYADFLDDVANGTIDSDALEAAKLLIGVLTSLPSEEDSLRDMVNEILGDYLEYSAGDKAKMRRFKPFGSGKSETDGTLCFVFEGVLVPVLWQKTKLGISSTAQDITAELLNYYQLYIQRRQLQGAFSMPVFGLEIMGDCIRVSGVFVGGKDVLYRVCYEPLTDFLVFHNLLKSQPKRMHTIARVMYALKRGVERAKNLHKEFFLSPNSQKLYTAGIPYNLRDQTRYQNVEWLEPPLDFQANYPGERKLLFTVQKSGEGLLLAKYVDQSYREDLHRKLADLNLAPKLHEVEVLPGGFKCIFMEYLDPSKGWHETINCKLPYEQLEPAIVAAIEKMHSAGIIHSDLRPCNILTRMTDGDLQVRIVDFDNLGEEGACKFPLFLNPEIRWPEGVSEGGLVTKVLDRDVFRATFDDEKARVQGRQKAYLPVRAMYTTAIPKRRLQKSLISVSHSGLRNRIFKL